jgi:hypothetical protein
MYVLFIHSHGYISTSQTKMYGGRYLWVLDCPSLVTSSNCRKTGIASTASSAGHSGRPAVDGLLPIGSCWLLGWISGLPA